LSFDVSFSNNYSHFKHTYLLKCCVFLQLYNKGGDDRTDARANFINIVRNAGEVGFVIFLKALVKSRQYDVARILDEELAKQFDVKRPPEAGLCTYETRRYSIAEGPRDALVTIKLLQL